MTALDSVLKLKKEGKSEGEIIAMLRSQGVSPMELSEALNQSKIKEAIYSSDLTQGMTPSIMQTDEEEQNQNYSSNTYNQEQKDNQQYSQNQDQYYPEQEQYVPQYPPQNNYYPNSPTNYSQNEYSSQDQYYDGEPSSIDTIMEISEQVFAEKIKKISKEIKEFTTFKNIFEIKIENLSQRLERMEKQFDKMQLSILDKVGEYGKGLEYLKKELNMVEDSLTKISKK